MNSILEKAVSEFVTQAKILSMLYRQRFARIHCTLGSFQAYCRWLAAKDLTEQLIEKFIKSIVKKVQCVQGADVIERAVKEVTVPLKVADAKSRMIKYITEITKLLILAGHRANKDNNT